MVKTAINYSRTIFIPDIHAPFCDTMALEAMYCFIKWWKPETIIYLGDVVDFYAVSHFIRDPERSLKLQDELDEAKSILSHVRRLCPTAKTYFIKGNHEARLQKYLWSQAKELSSLRTLKLENQLDFTDLKIEYIESGIMKYKGLIVKHGNLVRKYAGYTARGEFEKTGMSGVSGHTHRACTYYHCNENDSFVWMESGCLCKLDAEYLDGQTPNWQQGFGIGYFKENSKRFLLEFVPIINKKALYGGLEFHL